MISWGGHKGGGGGGEGKYAPPPGCMLKKGLYHYDILHTSVYFNAVICSLFRWQDGTCLDVNNNQHKNGEEWNEGKWVKCECNVSLVLVMPFT